jgi:hypothetical protein
MPKVMSRLITLLVATLLVLASGGAVAATPALAAPGENAGMPRQSHEGDPLPAGDEAAPSEGEATSEPTPAGDDGTTDGGYDVSEPAGDQIILEEPELASDPVVDGPEVTLDDRFAMVAQQIPGFGGLFYDENGQLTMYVSAGELNAPQADQEALRVASSAVLANVLGADERATAADQLRIVPGQYSFVELQQWHDRMSADVLATPGVVFTDIDEASNRLRIGVDAAQQQSVVEQQLAALGVPREAVVLEVTEPIQPAAHTLRSRVRPLVGGLQIRFTNGFCTLGFITTRAGVQGMLTNSHCTNVQGGVEGTVYHQHDVAGVVNRIGLETRDPLYFVGGVCPAGRRCRYSDSAFARVAHPFGPAVAVTRGFIARPAALGSLNISHVAPRYRIVAETAFPIVGETLNKVGRTTGWSQGRVIATCQRTNVNGTNITLLCQDRVRARVGPGDSGSPVFRITNAPAVRDVRLYGILWGGNQSGTEFVFSAMGATNVQRASEMGPLTTCAPGFGC